MCNRILVMLFATIALVAATAASAQTAPKIYRCLTSTPCANPGTTHGFVGPTETIELHVAPGPNPTAVGTVCLDGDGDEVCGFTARIAATDDLTFTGFTPNPALGLVTNFVPSTQIITMNHVNGLTGDSASFWLGTLNVDFGATGGSIFVDSTQTEAIGARLQAVSLTDNGPLAVPEPGFGMATSILGLALAAAARRRVSR